MKRVERQSVPRQLKAAIGVVVVVALGYGVAARFQHSDQPNAAGAPPSEAKSAQRAHAFDYFPDYYRNQATEFAEPIATF